MIDYIWGKIPCVRIITIIIHSLTKNSPKTICMSVVPILTQHQLQHQQNLNYMVIRVEFHMINTHHHQTTNTNSQKDFLSYHHTLLHYTDHGKIFQEHYLLNNVN